MYIRKDNINFSYLQQISSNLQKCPRTIKFSKVAEEGKHKENQLYFYIMAINIR